MNAAAAPQLSVVIPVYDNWWLTERCLRVLGELREGGTVAFETIVVDNASSDETPEQIGNFPWARYLRHEQNRNFAGACNAGAALARGALVLFLNNDAYPLGDALSPLVRAFERSEVVIASGALLYEDGATQAAGLVVLPNAHWHHSCRNLPSSLPEVRRSRDALAVGGAAMAVRTRWFLDAGAFDETYINGFEDIDLCLRARGEGRAIAYVADAAFAHYEGASEGRFAREHDNERRFFERWSGAMAGLPRVQRGEVGAVVVSAQDLSEFGGALETAAREDLEEALRSFGHPIVHDAVAPLQRLDRRFRRAASLGWFSRATSPGVVVSREADFPELSVRGAVELTVPWLPCAARERIERCALRRSPQATCETIAICGAAPVPLFNARVVAVTADMLLGRHAPLEVACVVHCALTDDAAFGNVLLAQAGIPAVVLDTQALRPIFAGDVALFAGPAEIGAAVQRFVEDAASRERYGARLAADARRRFSPRRTAIRVVDLLCASRFGLERPGTARSNSPLR